MSANVITDRSGDKKYYVQIPQIVWALSRTPYDFALWSTIKMVAGDGVCKLGTRDLATLSGMSVAKVHDSRTYFLAQGLLEGEKIRDPGYLNEVWNLSIPDLWEQNLVWRKELDQLFKGHHIIAKISWAMSFAQEIKELGILREIKDTAPVAIAAIRNAGLAAMEGIKSVAGRVHNTNDSLEERVQNTNAPPKHVHNANTLEKFLNEEPEKARSYCERIHEHVFKRVMSLLNESNKKMKDSMEEPRNPKPPESSGDAPGLKINFELGEIPHTELYQKWVYVNRTKAEAPDGNDLTSGFVINTTPKMLRVAIQGSDKPGLFKPEHVFYQNGMGPDNLYPVKAADDSDDRVLSPNQAAIKNALIDLMPLSGMESETITKRFMAEVQESAIKADSQDLSPDLFYLFQDYYYRVVWSWKPDAWETRPLNLPEIRKHWVSFVDWAHEVNFPANETENSNGYDYLTEEELSRAKEETPLCEEAAWQLELHDGDVDKAIHYMSKWRDPEEVKSYFASLEQKQEGSHVSVSA